WDAYYQLAKVLIKEGDEDSARSFMETLLKKNPGYKKRDEVESLLQKL
ncbi:hypothetical protein LCGC14_2369390, partial [marine sediment metagenome]